jgi:hypothetical protein
VRAFLKEEGHADSYEKLEVKYISGKNPDIFFYHDDGRLIEKIDIVQLSTQGIHDLLI